MRNIIVFLFFFANSPSRGQLNYEGNPLTENTEYTAEESHYSRRNDPRLSGEFNERNAKVIDSYVAAANSLNLDNEAKKSSSISSSLNSVSAYSQPLQTNDNIDVNPTANRESSSYQVPSITLFDATSSGQIQPLNAHTSNQQHGSTNAIQIASLPSSNEALDYFLKSQTPEESQSTLENYLRIHNQKGGTPGLSDGNQIDTKQNFISYTQDNSQQLRSENSLNSQSNGEITLHPNSHTIDQQIHQMNLLSSSAVDAWPQPYIQNRRNFIPPVPRQRRPLYHYSGPPSRLYRNRQHIQTRVGHYPPAHPPTLFIGGGPKPSSEIIYTRPPGFHGPSATPTAINNPPVPYEDASAHLPDSNHPTIPKDIYYSQLYSQSYDPYYYNYIAKTGKVKPWLYGKLGPKEQTGFWNELVHSFKNHGMKNMMNPMFLLGLSIPAVTLMLSAMVSKRSFDGRSMREFQPTDWTWNKKDIDKMHANLLVALQCLNEKKMKNVDPANCAN